MRQLKEVVMNCRIPLLYLTYSMLHSKGLSLSCYKCTSTDQESCRRWQQPEECDTVMLAPFCLTMKYTKHRQVSGRTIDEHTYTMRCARSDYGCQHHCKIEAMMGAISCKENCCSGDYCNKLQTPHLSPPKNKRSNVPLPHTPSYAAKLKGEGITNVSLLLVACITAIACF